MRHLYAPAAFVLVAILPGCHRPNLDSGTPAVIEPTPATFRAGTYVLRLCRISCGAAYPRNVIRSGWVVLDTAALNTKEFPDSVQRMLALAFMSHPSDRPNGCFRLDTTRPEIETYAGLMRGGLLEWSRGAGDSVSFALYHSPDAGHEVRVIGTVDGFVGVGHSWGAGVASVDYPDDVVIGEYIGPPDLLRCREAGLVFLARVRSASGRR